MFMFYVFLDTRGSPERDESARKVSGTLGIDHFMELLFHKRTLFGIFAWTT